MARPGQSSSLTTWAPLEWGARRSRSCSWVPSRASDAVQPALPLQRALELAATPARALVVVAAARQVLRVAEMTSRRMGRCRQWLAPSTRSTWCVAVGASLVCLVLCWLNPGVLTPAACVGFPPSTLLMPDVSARRSCADCGRWARVVCPYAGYAGHDAHPGTGR